MSENFRWKRGSVLVASTPWHWKVVDFVVQGLVWNKATVCRWFLRFPHIFSTCSKLLNTWLQGERKSKKRTALLRYFAIPSLDSSGVATEQALFFQPWSTSDPEQTAALHGDASWARFLSFSSKLVSTMKKKIEWSKSSQAKHSAIVTAKVTGKLGISLVTINFYYPPPSLLPTLPSLHDRCKATLPEVKVQLWNILQFVVHTGSLLFAVLSSLFSCFSFCELLDVQPETNGQRGGKPFVWRQECCVSSTLKSTVLGCLCFCRQRRDRGTKTWTDLEIMSE